MIEDSRADAVVDLGGAATTGAAPMLEAIAASAAPARHRRRRAPASDATLGLEQLLATQRARRRGRRHARRRGRVLALLVGLDRHARRAPATCTRARWRRRACSARACSASTETTSSSPPPSCSSPMASATAMSFPMSVGATAVLLPDRPTPDSVLATMLRAQPDHLLRRADAVRAPCWRSPGSARAPARRGCGCRTSAGEALPEDIGKRWQETVGIEIIDGIGSTEMLHIFVSNRPGKVRYGSSGTPVPGYEARAARRRRRARARKGEIGELVIKGPSAAEGYWLQREKIAATFRGEWTHTGDKYRIGEDGNYVLLRPHRRHVQGLGHLGVAVRGRERADHAQGRARGRRRSARRTPTASSSRRPSSC